jgi:hypothetical protein
MARFNQPVTITGVKRSKGEFEGRAFDSTKVYCETEVDESKGDTLGAMTVSHVWGTSDNFALFLPFKGKFPIKAEAVMEVVATAKGAQINLVDIKLPAVKG